MKGLRNIAVRCCHEKKVHLTAIYTDEFVFNIVFFARNFSPYEVYKNKKIFFCFIELKRSCKTEIVASGYKKFIKISDVAGSQPPGYILRLPLYVMSDNKVNVKLSAQDSNVMHDHVYEIGEYIYAHIQTIRNAFVFRRL